MRGTRLAITCVAVAAAISACSSSQTSGRTSAQTGVDAAALGQAHHPYVGDNSKNGAVFDALHFSVIAPITRVSLHTAARPYTVNLTLGGPVDGVGLTHVRDALTARSALALAAIDNADRIVWTLPVDGHIIRGSLNRGQAAKLLGRSLTAPSSAAQLEQDVAHLRV